MRRIALVPQMATAENFAPYGILAAAKQTPTFSSSVFEWHENLASFPLQGAELGYVRATASDAVQSQLERHTDTHEAIIPIDGDVYLVLAVGEASDDSDFAAFLLPLGCAAVLHPGIWHLAPKIKDKPAGAFILYKPETGGKDKELITLADKGLEVIIQW